MNNKKVIPLVLALGATLISCGVNPPAGESTVDPNEETKLTYDDIYHYEYKKSEEKTGLNTYRASDGYIENNIQGYNHFYYRAIKAGETLDMVYENDAFRSGDAYLDGKEMKSTLDTSAVREFISPVTGEAKISSSVKLIDGESPNFIVKVNDDIIYQTILNKEGYYNEKSVKLSKGDKVLFILNGEATISCNPEINFVASASAPLHHAIDGYYGDVHPFYDVEQKKMYMYYLSTGRQVNSTSRKDIFQSLLATSSDMITYNEDVLKMDEGARPEQDLYFVLNVFKDADGLYRTYQGMGNHASSATSTDLHTWRNGLIPYVDEQDDLFKYAHAAYNDSDVVQCRDPDTFWDEDTRSYYCVILSYLSQSAASGEKWINLYVGNDKGQFSTKATKMVNMTGRGDSECPQIKKIGDRWYLFYSVYGSGTAGNVGRLTYRVGEPGVLPQNVDWNSKPERLINGQDLHAAQLVQVGDKYYVYGWLNQHYKTNVWGGYLNTPVEVYQNTDGLLYSKLDPKFLELCNKGLLYKAENVSMSTNSFGTFNRSLIKTTLNMDSSNSYVSIKEGNRQFLVGVETSYSRTNLVIRNNEDGYCVDVPITKKDSYKLDIVVDDGFIEVNCNDEQVLSAITGLSASSDNIGLVLGAGSTASNINIYQLANSKNFYF